MIDPVPLVQELISFDTTNPPGAERACVEWVARYLGSAGLDVEVEAADANRPNVIARIRGHGHAAPLLLHGHVDVVGPGTEVWTHPPFSGVLADGFIWGRGALDMKSAVAAMMSACASIASSGHTPAADIVLAIVSDEEAGSECGIQFLTRERSHFFDGVRYSIGEAGVPSLDIDGTRLYPITVAEKQGCWMRLTIRGHSGHASIPVRDQTIARLGEALTRLAGYRSKIQLTPVVMAMIDDIREGMRDSDFGAKLGRFRDGLQTLESLGRFREMFEPLVTNTVSATVVRAGSKVNVHPDEAVVEIDARLLPGTRPAEVTADLHALLEGLEHELVITYFDPYPAEVDDGLYPILREVTLAEDPAAIVVRQLATGVTDARFLTALSIQNYGFMPMPLPPGFDARALVHSVDERVPVAGVMFLARCYEGLIKRYGVDNH